MKTFIKLILKTYFKNQLFIHLLPIVLINFLNEISFISICFAIILPIRFNRNLSFFNRYFQVAKLYRNRLINYVIPIIIFIIEIIFITILSNLNLYFILTILPLYVIILIFIYLKITYDINK